MIAKGSVSGVTNSRKPSQTYEESADQSAEKPVCGIVMPISAIDGCSQAHWHEVKQILEFSIKEAGFSTKLVSDADDSGVIQKRIIQNLYHNNIVVCDVSAKNPNVMFELGIRLAFNKPTVIVKDDKTDYSFDTSVIEHISYPRDLRYNSMLEFQKELSRKVKATYEKSSEPDYTTFLGHFGEFKVAEIQEKEVTADKFIIDILRDISNRIDMQEHFIRRMSLEGALWEKKRIKSEKALGRGAFKLEDVCLGVVFDESETKEKINSLIGSYGVKEVSFVEQDDHLHAHVYYNGDRDVLKAALEKIVEC